MWVKLLLLFFAFSFLFKSDFSFDQDLGRHIKLGEIILNTQTIPKTNLFSYTNTDFPFINTHWLFEVLVYLAASSVGLQPLLIFKLFILLTSVWLALRIIPKENRALMIPIGFIFLHVLRERTELRPEVFSFLFTALTLYILSQSKKIYLLPLIQLIWINTHIYFFVGLVLQAIFLVRGKNLKLPCITLLISILVSLINPNGLAGLLYPLNVTKNYGYTIVENQTMFFLENIGFRDPNFLFVKLSIGLIFLAMVLSLIRKQLKPVNFLLAGFGISLALLNVRSFPYLVFLSLPATLQNFGNIKRSAILQILAAFFTLLLLLESFFYLSGDYYRYKDDSYSRGIKFTASGQPALDFVLKNNLPAPIYNNFDIGSYIIYRGYPNYKVFVDGRPEGYPKQFFTDTYIPTEYDSNKFKQLEKQYQFKTIIFSHTDQTPWGSAFLKEIIWDTNWSLVYLDNFMIVLVKKETAEALSLKNINLKNLTPEAFKFDNHVYYLRVALFLFATQNNGAGLKFVQKSLEIFPDSPLGNSIMAAATGQPQFNLKKSNFFW